MAAEFTLASSIFTSIDEGLATVYSTGLNGFVDIIAPLIGACVSLYAVLIALNWIWSGNTSELPIGDLMKRMFFMALFTLFAFNATYYKSTVVDPVNKIGSEISEAFASTGSSAPQIVDQMGTQIFETIETIWENSPEMSLTNLNIVPLWQTIQAIVVVAFFGFIFMAISFLYLTIAKIMVALVLLLGPLFISFAFFPITREYFMKWLGQLLNYIILYALFGITFTLLTNLLQKYTSGDAFSNVLVGDATVLKLFFCYILFTGVIMAVPGLASQLTGGVGINSLTGGLAGVAGGASRLLGKALGGAGKAGSSAAKAGGNLISGGKNRRLG